MVSYELKINNVDRKLKKIISKMDFTLPMQEWLRFWRGEYDRNFETEGAIYGGGGFVRAGGAFQNLSQATTKSGKAWQPLAERTRRERAALGYGAARPILYRTGNLKRNVSLEVRGKNKVAIVNDTPYAAKHQLGQGVPVRKIIGVSDKSAQALRISISNYLKDLLHT